MSQFIEPPPLNDPIVRDSTGIIRSTAWVLWLNNLADAIQSGVLDNVGPTQATSGGDTTQTYRDDTVEFSVFNYDAHTESSYTPEEFPIYLAYTGENSSVSSTVIITGTPDPIPYNYESSATNTQDNSGYDTLYWIGV